MKETRICAVVTGKTREEFLSNLEKTQKVADFVELRVDYIKGISIDDIDLIKSKTYKNAIFTCRKKEEGGFFTGDEGERNAILKKACNIGFDYVDIELSSAEEFVFLKNSETKIVLSFHDFAKTPTLPELIEIKKMMKLYNYDVMKFATFVRDDNDKKILFQFLLDKRDSEKMIVAGMGEKGRLVRVIGPLIGSYLTYVSTSYSQSAPGQVDIDKIKKLYNDLGDI